MIGKVIQNQMQLAYKHAARFSLFEKVQALPDDPILGLNEEFKKDTFPKKVSLGAGAYRDDNGQPWILNSVKKAIDQINSAKQDYEYLGIQGNIPFINASLKLALGEESNGLKEKRIAGIQSLSGTGSLYIGLNFLKKFLPGDPIIYITKPSWPIHKTQSEFLGFKVVDVPYYDPKTKGLDWTGYLKGVNDAPNGSLFLLHCSAHNPTGVDLSTDQWNQLRDVFAKKQHFAFFDMAYQGFASGDIVRDAYSVRLWDKSNLPFACAQSYAKNFGLYGTRTGCFSVSTANEAEKSRVTTQLQYFARNTWSNPPLTGARIVETVLTNPDLTKIWFEDIRIMSSRIKDMRTQFRQGLEKRGSPHNWKHVTDQIGMFAFTGITTPQVLKLRSDYHIYLTDNGRISVAGLNSKNVDHVADCFDKITRQ